MKKIGYVIPTFPVLSETFVGVEMRAMMALGHAVQPFAFEASAQCQVDDQALAAQCEYIPSRLDLSASRYMLRWKAAHNFINQQQGYRYRSLLKQGAILASLADKHGCDHLHAHFAWHSAAVAIVAAQLCGISVSFVGHGADIYRGPQDLSAKLQHVDFAVAVTRQMQKELRTLTSRPVHYVACGLEREKIPPLPSQWQPDQHFVFVGRLVEKKDLGLLLHALKSVESARLDIVGDGPLRERLESWIAELDLGDRVRCFGAQPKSWFINHAQQYRALVAPFCIATDGDRDTGPLVVKEAMALGLPVITTNLPGCNEILTAQSGTRVPMGDQQQLAQAMRSVLSAPITQLYAMRKNAYQRVFEHYSSEQHAATLSRCIEGVDEVATPLEPEHASLT
uniref:glycosyltransferase n=1 Tax=Thaumasiovibrio occultus TaxID=1891184 RepID=UPI000B357027|nr:glycosyltransferase [Thaumasiovibrio occultus]